MSSLHIINSALNHHQLERLNALTACGDGILLIQDACYLLMSKDLTAQLIAIGSPCYAITADLQARNIECQQVTMINYQEFVELTLTYQNTISW